VTCSNDKPDKGGTLLKAGTRQRQQLVAVQPKGTGTLFRLIYLSLRGRFVESIHLRPYAHLSIETLPR
jgi:hypothetical protein